MCQTILKHIYDDKWTEGILYYVGMGQVGNQRKDFHQNKTLAESQNNGVKIHLFEVFKTKKIQLQGRS